MTTTSLDDDLPKAVAALASLSDEEKQFMIDEFAVVLTLESLKAQGLVDGDPPYQMPFVFMGYGYLMALGFKPSDDKATITAHVASMQQ